MTFRYVPTADASSSKWRNGSGCRRGGSRARGRNAGLEPQGQPRTHNSQAEGRTPQHAGLNAHLPWAAERWCVPV